MTKSELIKTIKDIIWHWIDRQVGKDRNKNQI